MSKPMVSVGVVLLVLFLSFPLISRVSAKRHETSVRQPESTVSVEPSGVPVIVSMNPPNGAAGVSASLTQLAVTFDQPMGTGFSWTGGGPSFPEALDKPYWTPDQRTCVMQVRLKPNWSYRLGVNSRSHRNFKSQSGVAATPVVWQFTTGG